MESRLYKRDHKRNLKIWSIMFLAWIIIFIAFFWGVGWDETVGVVITLNPIYIFLAIFTFVASIITVTFSWGFLMSFLKIKLSFIDTLRILMSGFFVDNVLPNLAPGGEITMGYLLHKKAKVSLSKSFASVMVQVIAWFFSFIFFTFIILLGLLFFNAISMETAILITVLLIPFLFFLILIIYLAVNPKVSERVIISLIKGFFKYVLRFSRFKKKEARIIKQVRKTVKSFSKVFKTYFKQKFVLIFAIAVMILYQFFIALSFYFVVLAFGGEISFLVATGIFMIVTLVSLLSMVPGQLGIFEILSVSLLSLNMGVVNGALIVSVVRLIQYWSIVFIGGFFALGYGLETISEVKKKVKR